MTGLMGMENEYAFSTRGSASGLRDREIHLGQMLQLVAQALRCLPGVNVAHDLFLENGARLYVDMGLHPEYSTPECTNPAEVVAYSRAGDHILHQAARALEAAVPQIAEAFLFKCNVDYHRGGVTWGSHESFLHRCSQGVLPAQIIPHLVSRIIFSGAGGFNNQSPGIEFMLSPRVVYLEKIVSGDSTANRGIFHTKDEPLCQRGYHRLHLICGENLCSQVADYLRMGTTALVVALTDAGVKPGEAMALQSPVRAMRTFAGDLTCTATTDLLRGGAVTAIQLQRHYLRQVERHLGSPFMPAWAPQVCQTWRTVLEQLEATPEALAIQLDWQLKLKLFRDRARRRQIPWKALGAWNWLLTRVKAGCEVRGQTLELNRDSIERHCRDTLAGVTDLFMERLESHGQSWDRLDDFLALRAELFEIDMCYGQLGPKGLFTALDQAGVLNHEVISAGTIHHATGNPPPGGRAKRRGEAIRRLASTRQGYTCNWETIVDHHEARIIRMHDPFLSSGERWEALDKLLS